MVGNFQIKINADPLDLFCLTPKGLMRLCLRKGGGGYFINPLLYSNYIIVSKQAPVSQYIFFH